MALASANSASTVEVSVFRFQSSVLRFRFSAVLNVSLRLRSLTGQRCGIGFSRPACSNHVLDRGTGELVLLRIFHASAFRALQGGLVLWYCPGSSAKA